MILIYLMFSAHPIDLKILCGMSPFTATQSTKMNFLATDTFFFIAKKIFNKSIIKKHQA